MSPDTSMAARQAPARTPVAARGDGPAPASYGGKRAEVPVAAFASSELGLLAGPFEAARALAVLDLLAIDPDRLLRELHAAAASPPGPAAGMQGPCPAYALGRYLSACSRAWASTRQAPLRERADRVVNELRACQHTPGGWAAAISLEELPAHDNLGAVLAWDRGPWHGLQALLAGLRDAHLHARLPRALAVLARLVDRIDEAAQADAGRGLQRPPGHAHGGMSDVLADLFMLTGQRRYLRLAERLGDRVGVDALAQGRGLPAAGHTVARIPDLTGLARLHGLLAADPVHRSVRSLWHDGPGSGPAVCAGLVDDCFADAGMPLHPARATRGLPSRAGDLLRLTRMLFAAEPLAAYADCQERVLFNSVLACPDPCIEAADHIYAHQGDVLYVNQFIASRVDWSDKRVSIRQDTVFPDEATTRLSISCARRTRFTMRLRHPAWCRRLDVAINGRAFMASEVAGRFVDIERTWCDGDVVDVRLPMHPYTRPVAGRKDLVTCMVGPLLLAARAEPGKDSPLLDLGGERLEELAGRTPGTSLSFQLSGSGPDAGLELKPLRAIAPERFILHWQLVSRPGAKGPAASTRAAPSPIPEHIP